MSTDNPELLVVRHMRDAARQLRSLARRPDVAKIALREEERFDKLVSALESKQVQTELAMESAA
jgi:hypothetical protein